MLSLGKKQQWKDLEGNPTSNEDVTHWDENGFLEIREEVEGEELKGEEVKRGEPQQAQGQFGKVLASKSVKEEELDDFARMQRKFYGLDQPGIEKPIKSSSNVKTPK